MSRQWNLGSGDVHFVPAQDGVGILLSPQVIKSGNILLGLPGLDPAHLDGVDQLGDLRRIPGVWGGRRGEEKSFPSFSSHWSFSFLLSFSLLIIPLGSSQSPHPIGIFPISSAFHPHPTWIFPTFTSHWDFPNPLNPLGSFHPLQLFPPRHPTRIFPSSSSHPDLSSLPIPPGLFHPPHPT